MQTFIAIIDFNGSYLKEIFEYCRAIDSDNDHTYNIEFKISGNTLYHKSDNVIIEIITPDHHFEKSAFEIDTNISIRVMKNGIEYINIHSLNDTLLAMIKYLVSEEIIAHTQLSSYFSLKELEIYINYIAILMGLGDFPTEYLEEHTLSCMKTNLELVFKGEYPNPNAYRGLPIKLIKSAR